jgi:hypothetical protein
LQWHRPTATGGAEILYDADPHMQRPIKVAGGVC